MHLGVTINSAELNSIFTKLNFIVHFYWIRNIQTSHMTSLIRSFTSLVWLPHFSAAHLLEHGSHRIRKALKTILLAESVEQYSARLQTGLLLNLQYQSRPLSVFSGFFDEFV